MFGFRLTLSHNSYLNSHNSRSTHNSFSYLIIAHSRENVSQNEKFNEKYHSVGGPWYTTLPLVVQIILSGVLFIWVLEEFILKQYPYPYKNGGVTIKKKRKKKWKSKLEAETRGRCKHKTQTISHQEPSNKEMEGRSSEEEEE
ncbi:hypothetical protein ACB092_09G035900 [Castanea dentata]